MVKQPEEPEDVQINARVPPLMSDRIAVAKGILGLTQNQMVNQGLVLFFEHLSARTRKAIEEALAVRQKP